MTSNAKEKEHLVERGQSLQSIAETYNITEQELIDANPGVEDFFYTGMMLTIPEKSGSTSTRQNSVSNQVPTNTPSTPRRTQRTYAEPTTTSQEDNEEVETQKPKREFRPVTDNTHTTYTENSNSSYNSDEVSHPIHFSLIYQLLSFEDTKYSSVYGVGLTANSIGHWGIFHIGANLNFCINAGVIDDWGCLIDFGPMARIDIAKHYFVTIPVNASCSVTFPEKSTDTKTTWGAKIAPSINCFFSDKFGIFLGPQMSIPFAEGAKVGFGLQAGLSFSF